MTQVKPVRIRFSPLNATQESPPYVTGFLHLWAVYVRAFDPRFHCQRCLRGRISDQIRTGCTPIEIDLSLNETSNFDCIYVCGVAQGAIKSRKRNNLHLPLAFSPGASSEHRTYNEYAVYVSNAVVLSIPELPDGWMGLSNSFLRCCNFRFGVDRFGYTCDTKLAASKSGRRTRPNLPVVQANG